MTDDKTFMISTQTANEIIDELLTLGYEPDFYEGCLLDNWLCELGENDFEFGSCSGKQFLLILEKPLTTWTSGLKLILTDNEEIFYKYKNMFEDREIRGYEERCCG